MEMSDNEKPTVVELTLPPIFSKVGVFTLPLLAMSQDYEKMLRLFAQVLVTRCEFIYTHDGGVFVYEGCSEMFRKVPTGARPPEYVLRYNTRADKWDAVLTSVAQSIVKPGRSN